MRDYVEHRRQLQEVIVRDPVLGFPIEKYSALPKDEQRRIMRLKYVCRRLLLLCVSVHRV